MTKIVWYPVSEPDFPATLAEKSWIHHLAGILTNFSVYLQVLNTDIFVDSEHDDLDEGDENHL